MYQGKFSNEPSAEVTTTPAESAPAPQQTSAPRRNPDRKKSQRRRKGPTTGTLVFYIIYLVLILAFFIGITIAMDALVGWLVGFQASQPEEKSEAVFHQLFDNPDWAALYKHTYPGATEEEVADYVAKITALVGDQKLTFTSTSAGLSGDKKYFVCIDSDWASLYKCTYPDATAEEIAEYVAKITEQKLTSTGADLSGDKKNDTSIHNLGIATFILTADNKDSNTPNWYLGSIELEPLPYVPRIPPKIVYLSYNIITMPGYTVTVNGEALTEEHLIRTVTTKADDYLPEGINGYHLHEYRIAGLDSVPEITITDPAGQPVETNFDEVTKTYVQVLPEAPTISAEDAEYQSILGAAKAWTKYMVTGSKTDLKKYYNTSSQVYKDIISGEVFRQDYTSYSYEPEEITDYYRYSDTLFSAKIKLDCIVIRKADGYNKLFTIDGTFIFQWTGDKWMVYDRTNIDIQERYEEVRLTFKDAEGNVISNEFVDSSIKFLTTPTVEIPEGKVLDGWYVQSFDEEGGEYLKKMFVPDANGTVNLTGNTEPLKSVVLVPFFADAQEEA